MPSKLKKALGAVKDQTSISLAKVSNTNASNVEVLILKATRHDEGPIDERYVNEILELIYSSKVYAVACAQVISKRIGKTRNWIVALKSLMLVFRIFQDGDPYFPREVIHAMKRGHKILNLGNFRDDSKSNPWDFTAFVRTFALYLDERLDCFMAGKLQKKLSHRERDNGRTRRGFEAICDMKPIVLLDRISYWQRLLDRAIGSRPTGEAKDKKLVRICLHAIVQESFELYKDLSDALALLLDSFFHLQYQSCVSAFQACVKASKQWDELSTFYDVCKSAGVGRTSEYPSVQKISDELLETLQEFLKDQASFPTGRSPLMLPAPPGKDPGSSSDRGDTFDQSLDPAERYSERGSDYGSHCTSLEDLMSGGTSTSPSPCPSIEHLMNLTEERRSRSMSPSIEHNVNVRDGGTSPSPSPSTEQFKKPSQQVDLLSDTDPWPNNFLPNHNAKDVSLDLVLFDDWTQVDQKQDEQQQQQGEQASSLEMESASGARDDWLLMLAQTATQPPLENPSNAPVEDNFIDQASVPQSQNNPFLDNVANTFSSLAIVVGNEPATFTDFDEFSVAPTFQAKPRISAHNPNQTTMAFQSDDDPFGPCPAFVADNIVSSGSVDQQIVLQEQLLWLQNQNKIIAKHMA